MNIVDILSILPFFIELFMHEEAVDEAGQSVDIEASQSAASVGWLTNSSVGLTSITPMAGDQQEEEEEEEDNFKGLVQVFRVFKLARAFKLAR